MSSTDSACGIPQEFPELMRRANVVVRSGIGAAPFAVFQRARVCAGRFRTSATARFRKPAPLQERQGCGTRKNSDVFHSERSEESLSDRCQIDREIPRRKHARNDKTRFFVACHARGSLFRRAGFYYFADYFSRAGFLFLGYDEGPAWRIAVLVRGDADFAEAGH